MKTVLRLCTGALVVALMACNGGGTGNGDGGDGTNPGDTQGTDSASHDAVPSDASHGDAVNSDATNSDGVSDDVPQADAIADGTESDGAEDAAPGDAVSTDAGGDPCANGAAVNLNTAGTMSGPTTTYMGSNTSAPETSTVIGSCGTPGWVVAFSYTLHTESQLIVSTFHTATMDNLDTVVWVSTTCGGTGSELCCDDDVAGSSDTTRPTAPPSSAIRESMCSTVPPPAADAGASDTLPAGTTVYIFVAGYDYGSGGGGTYISQGPFQLTVTEVTPPEAAGTPCDPAAANAMCASGLGCAATGVDYSSFACAADGAAYTPCRTTGTPCDTGLACTTNTPMICLPSVAVGGMCDPSGQTNACATGSSCVTGTSGTSTCVLDGTQGGICLTTAPACAAGLTCSPFDICAPTVPVGGMCDPNEQTNTCATGSSCVTGTAGTSTCIADGTQGGQCLTTTPVCAAGLTCSPFNICAPTVPVGGMCDPSGATTVCATGSSCITAPGTTVAKCLADGSLYGNCAATTPSCAAGLVCSPFFFTCLPQVPVGGACDPSGAMNACATGSSCATPTGATTSTCIADGQAFGQCLGATPPCATGLACSGNDVCLTAVPAGGNCDPSGAANVCATGTSCVTAGATSTCVANGAAGGSCLQTAPACDPNLVCNGDPTFSSSICVPVIAVGQPCDATGVANRCAMGAVCDATTCATHGYVSSASSATWIDACAAPGSATLLSASDDGVDSVPLPFAITFYGNSYAAGSATSVTVNGWFSFTPNQQADWTPGALPLATPDNAIYPMFFDLNFANPNGGNPGNICYATTGTAPSRTLAIEWFDAWYFGGSASDFSTFEIQFHENSGAFDVVYDTVLGTEPEANATVGVESPLGSSYLQICAAGGCMATNFTNTRYTPMP